MLPVLLTAPKSGRHDDFVLVAINLGHAFPPIPSGWDGNALRKKLDVRGAWPVCRDSAGTEVSVIA